MICNECKVSNPDDSRFCSQCGAELGRTLEETLLKKFRDRKAIEIGLTEAVATRLFKWGKWLAAILALVVAAFTLFLGKTALDLSTQVNAARMEIASMVDESEKQIRSTESDVGNLHETAKRLQGDFQQLQSDATKYRAATQKIDELRRDLDKAKGDWGHIDLTVRSLRTPVTAGPGALGFYFAQCPPLASKDVTVEYCPNGSPVTLFQVTADGQARPVASLSTIGFQDVSTTPKPSCDAQERGMLYVDKGAGNRADQAFVCLRESNGSYNWATLTASH